MSTESRGPLNDVQLMLLKLFSRPMSPNEVETIQEMLLDYYDKLLQEEVEKNIEAKGITRSDFENLLKKSPTD